MVQTDNYFKKVLDFGYDGISLEFRVSQSLFSSHQIDIGTQRLLNTMQSLAVHKDLKILDLGCGYGPIGLSLAKRYPDNRVHLVDRDALALEYTRQNAALNGVDNCHIYGSVGYDEVKDNDFDLIVSNIPGKAGEKVIATLLEDAQYYLKPDGVVAIVVVTPLQELVSSVLDNPGIELLFRSEFKGHIVYHYKFTSTPASYAHKSGIERGIYHRENISLSFSNYDIEIKTAYGMPEFDTLDYQTELVIKILLSLSPASAKRVVVYNPGQGYLPALIWRLYMPEYIILVSRDLLSLRYTASNLQLNGCPVKRIFQLHQIGWELHEAHKQFPLNENPANIADCVFGFLQQDESSEASIIAVKHTAECLQVGGTLYVAGGSTPITRVLKGINAEKRLLLKKRRKYQGKSVAIFHRRN